ncbi:MAG: 1-deoxy-D-xylulose-5-phosphate synthase [Candidatus Muiribacteriota bacterium]
MIVDKIKELTANLKNLDIEGLETLAHYIRKHIINVVSKNGGHLASSLGAVEIALACHYLMNTPEDKIIWDVGHQAYAHKILTGREEFFTTLRQYKGMSGFPKMSESIHDAFGVGHSSTSISAALGYAVASKQNGKNNKIVAIIGDGSISSGMPFEAMNQAAHIEDIDMTVILNDNEMSISPNVGALSRYFNKLRSEPTYTKLRDDMEYALSRIPTIGKNMVEVIDRVSKGIKTIIEPGVFFTQLGWDYYGPIDGHNVEEIIDTFDKVFKIKGLKIIHVVTKKGKGYRFAEKNPSVFHGVGKFDIDTGEIAKSSDKSYTDIVAETLIEMAETNENINVITAAMPDGTGTLPFCNKFPERFFDIGISEEHAATFAAALAIEGKIPFVSIYSTFLQRSIDQIIHDVCLQELPVVFLLDRGGIVGEDGATHHGTFDLSYLRYIPNINICTPRNNEELKDMMFTATKLREKKAYAIRYPRGKAELVEARERKVMEIGKAEKVKQGSKICVAACGYLVNNVQEALKDTDYAIYDFKWIKPIDKEAVKEIAENYEKLYVYEENSIIGGLGSAILEEMAAFNKKPEIFLKGIPDMFVPHGAQNILRDDLGFSVQKIREEVK